MLALFFLICIVCVILQQVQLWKIRKYFRNISEVAADFLEDCSHEFR